ncbi:MAG TPA: HPr family phosphocarrier protein [Planctomycetaceae bacterium]
MSDVPVRRATVTVRLPEGLHLRPMTQIARVAQSFSATAILRKGDLTADATRPLDLLTLEAACGTRLELETRGDDADAAAEAIVRLFETDFADGD